MEIKIACGKGLKEEDWKVCDYLKSCEEWPTVSDVVAATGPHERKVYYAMRRIVFQMRIYEGRRHFISQCKDDKEQP